MKWKHLLTKKGDSGFSQFRNKRIPKNSPIFWLLAEIDDLNSKIGMYCDLEVSQKLQAVNRAIMGYMHTGGKYCAPEITSGLKDLEQWCEPLAEALDQYGSPKGWYDYDSPIFSACTQVRKVELLLWDHFFNADEQDWGMIFPTCTQDGYEYFFPDEVFLKYFNRLSKFLYMAAVFDSLEEQKFQKKKMEVER